MLEDAKDAFQNGMMEFYCKAQDKTFVIRGSLKTTIYSFGYLQLLAFFKKERYLYCEADSLEGLGMLFKDDYFETDCRALVSEKENWLLEALQGLPEKRRVILRLRFFEGLKSKEIAEKLNVTPGHVDNNAGKACRQLRAMLTGKTMPLSPQQRF